PFLDGLDIRRHLDRLGLEALPCLAHIGLSEVVLCWLLGGAEAVQASAGLHALAALGDGGPGGFDGGALHFASTNSPASLSRYHVSALMPPCPTMAAFACTIFQLLSR